MNVLVQERERERACIWACLGAYFVWFKNLNKKYLQEGANMYNDSCVEFYALSQHSLGNDCLLLLFAL